MKLEDGTETKDAPEFQRAFRPPEEINARTFFIIVSQDNPSLLYRWLVFSRPSIENVTKRPARRHFSELTPGFSLPRLPVWLKSRLDETSNILPKTERALRVT
jgi:hypothetical protein